MKTSTDDRRVISIAMIYCNYAVWSWFDLPRSVLSCSPRLSMHSPVHSDWVCTHLITQTEYVLIHSCSVRTHCPDPVLPDYALIWSFSILSMYPRLSMHSPIHPDWACTNLSSSLSLLNLSCSLRFFTLMGLLGMNQAAMNLHRTTTCCRNQTRHQSVMHNVTLTEKSCKVLPYNSEVLKTL